MIEQVDKLQTNIRFDNNFFIIIRDIADVFLKLDAWISHAYNAGRYTFQEVYLDIDFLIIRMVGYNTQHEFCTRRALK